MNGKLFLKNFWIIKFQTQNSFMNWIMSLWAHEFGLELG
jgi:hypothetical protein